ncbi:Glu-tRNA(Gln) amidotransferase subunit GatE [Candidatus Woesearchaeota archaeon]|nr:Glu-tRNA(Gln) amidotransferase subunit GatE [Candidatus Woesearchaeota archaeon]
MNYKELGLKVGLEIHFQLNSNKLFCRCPSILRDEEPDILVKRKLRAVSSELGKKDIVAEYEIAKNKYAVYEAYKDTICLVELDESPPEDIDKKAFKTALEIAMLLNCEIVDELQIMRKQVIDYSNTSGFQRTGLLARNGYAKTNLGKVGISMVCIEEDAARKMNEQEDFVVYRLDRLGIPLVEIVTGPDIQSPEQAKEVAEYIGMLVKSTGKKRGGIGSVRQDLNVSINKGARVEIKGVQDLKGIPDIINNEVLRQLKLIKEDKKVNSEVRNANPDGTSEFLRPMPGSTRLYPETDIPTIEITSELLSNIKKPELITEKIINIEKKYNISSELAKEIFEKNINLDKFLMKNLDANYIARVLIDTPKEIKSRLNLDSDKLKEYDFLLVLREISNGIPRQAAIDMLSDIIKTGKLDVNKYKAVSDKTLEKDIYEIIKKNKGASMNALIGEAMKKYRNKIDGKKIVELIKKLS